MKTIAIIQARMGSTRLPGKVMRDLADKPVLQWSIEAAAQATGIDKVIVATSTLAADDIIAKWCYNNHIHFSRGSETDVLSRFYETAKVENTDVVLRLTADCPFLDSAVIGEVIKLRAMTGAQYASNINPPTYPDGLDVECFTFDALECAWKEATRPLDRDCVTQFIVRNRHRFKAANLTCPLPGLVKERWVLDTEDDFKFCQQVAEKIRHPASYLYILSFLDEYPEIRKINGHGIRNERFYEGLADERLPARTFERSQRIFEQASQAIPFGSQTFSKSHIQYPDGAAPLFVSHGDGARIFDIDGNDYVDLVGALLPVVLGYCDPNVDEAVRRQLSSGISFSLATELEYRLAEKLISLISCAEMVKFGKNGSDVTSAAVRLARHCTGRDMIIHTGYHGWQDWSIAGSGYGNGVPKAVSDLSIKVPYGSLVHVEDAFLANPGKVAALIVDPSEIIPSGQRMEPALYLNELRLLSNKYKCLLVFDEIITGFRWHIGGAQALYNVIPDLVCFGKAMGNGMPISALVGRKDIMRKMAPPDNIFYSGTFFGETLSLAAALVTIEKIERENVIGHLWDTGQQLKNAIQQIVDSWGLSHIISLDGEPPRIMVNFRDHTNASKEQLRALYMKEMIQNGVLVINSHNISYAHKTPEIKRIVKAYNGALTAIRDCIDYGDAEKRIGSHAFSGSPIRKAWP